VSESPPDGNHRSYLGTKILLLITILLLLLSSLLYFKQIHAQKELNSGSSIANGAITAQKLSPELQMQLAYDMKVMGAIPITDSNGLPTSCGSGQVLSFSNGKIICVTLSLTTNGAVNVAAVGTPGYAGIVNPDQEASNINGAGSGSSVGSGSGGVSGINATSLGYGLGGGISSSVLSLRLIANSSGGIIDNANGLSLTASCGNGQLLKWNGSSWGCANDNSSNVTTAALTSTTSGLTITGGSGAVVGTGTNISIATATNTQAGLLSPIDWNTFNNKQGAIDFVGNGMFSESGNTVTDNTSCASGQVLAYDGVNWDCANQTTATSYTAGTGITLTGTQFNLTTVGTPGSYGSSTVIPAFTVNAEGQITGVTNDTIPTAGTSTTGLLSSADYTTFNGKQAALTFGDLTSPTTGVSVSGGSGAVIGGGASVSIATASAGQAGLLDSADWSTFNNKQGALTFVGDGIFSESGSTITDNTTCSGGQVLEYDGSNWDCTTPASYVAGPGIATYNAGGGNTGIELDPSSLSAVTSATSGDEFLVYNGTTTSTITYGNLLGGISGGLNYQGTWNANTNTPSLTTGSCTNINEGYYYTVSISGTTTLDGNSTWTAGDEVVCNGTDWERVQSSSDYGVTYTAENSGGNVNSPINVNGDAIGFSNGSTAGDEWVWDGNEWALGTPSTYYASTGLNLNGTTFSLANVGSSGTYGDSTDIPVISTNGQGQITGVSDSAIPTGNSSTTGLITSSDWNDFNDKQDALSFGNLTSSTSGVIVTNGSGAVVGSGTSVDIATASSSQDGLIDSIDWNTFNNKQNVLTFNGYGMFSESGNSVNANTSCSTNQYLMYSGSIWNCETPTVGALDSQTPSSTGAVAIGNVLYLQSASSTNPGLINTLTQTFAGNKSFNGSTTLGSLSSNSLTIKGTAVNLPNGMALSSSATTNVSITTGTTGALTLDSGTTGNVNLGTGASAKTISIGNSSGVTGLVINTGTSGTNNTSTTTSGTAESLTDNALTSGTALAVNSSSTGLTGTLASISLSGNNAGNSGSILSLINSGALNSGTVESITNAGSGTGINVANTGGGLAINVASGAVAFQHGTDYTTITSNEAVFGNTSLVRLNGASAQTINGILAGSDGQILTIINAGADPATFTNLSGLATNPGDEINTGTGGTLTLPSSASIQLVYDSQAGNWSIVSSNELTGVSMSSLTQALSDNTLDNAGYTQTWNWNSIGANKGIVINSTDTTASNNLVDVVSASTSSSVANGLARFDFTGNHTGNGLEIDDATLAGNAVAINANSLTSGSGLVVSSSSASSTGSSLVSFNQSSSSALGATLTLTNAGTVGGLALDISSGGLAIASQAYSTAGVSNNASLGTSSNINLTGASTQTITGIANGTNGKILYISDNAATSAVLSNNSSSSSVGDRIVSPNGADLALAPNGAATLIYNGTAGSGVWDIVSSTGTQLARARIYSTSVTSLTASTATPVALANNSYDVNADISTNANEITITQAGLYMITGNACITTNNGNDTYQTQVKVNAATVVEASASDSTSGQPSCSEASITEQLAVGAIISLDGYQTSAGSATTVSGSANTYLQAIEIPSYGTP
jgi:hypothetical protein